MISMEVHILSRGSSICVKLWVLADKYIGNPWALARIIDTVVLLVAVLVCDEDDS